MGRLRPRYARYRHVSVALVVPLCGVSSRATSQVRARDGDLFARIDRLRAAGEPVRPRDAVVLIHRAEEREVKAHLPSGLTRMESHLHSGSYCCGGTNNTLAVGCRWDANGA